MKKITIILIVVLLISACGNQTKETSTETAGWIFPTTDIKSVNLENDAGDFVLRPTSEDNIEITTIKTADTPNDLNRVEVNVQQTGDAIIGKVSPKSNSSNNVSVSFEIRVPQNLSIQIESSSGNIRVKSYKGSLDISTSSGAITLEDVNGMIRANTANGQIEASNVDGDVNISSSSGNIVATYNADLHTTDTSTHLEDVLKLWTYELKPDGSRFSSSPKLPGTDKRIFENSSGSITLKLANNLQADVFVQLFSGNFQSDFHQLQGSTDNVRYTGRINNGGPLIILVNASGAVRLEALPTP